MILFSDIIGLVIVFYTWFRLYDNHHMDRRSKLIYAISGFWLAVLLVLDQIWQLIFEKKNFTDFDNTALNVITCMIYLMIPLAMAGMLIMPTLKTVFVEKIFDIIFVLIFMALPIVNIWKPILFCHFNGDISYTLTHDVYVAFELLVFMFFIRQYYSRTFPFDFSDNAMLAFAQILVVIGVVANIGYNELLVTWNCLSLCYLLLLLAIEQMFAKLDSVTKLHNRDAYVKYIFRLKRKADVTVVMFDLNRLKHFNDTYGHSAGDAYLMAFAQTTSKRLKKYGELFRVGGDEFCFVSTLANTETLKTILDKLREENKCDEEFGDYPVDFAYGIAERTTGENVFATVERADENMYRDKDEQRKNRPDEIDADRSYVRR